MSKLMLSLVNQSNLSWEFFGMVFNTFTIYKKHSKLFPLRYSTVYKGQILKVIVRFVALGLSVQSS